MCNFWGSILAPELRGGGGENSMHRFFVFFFCPPFSQEPTTTLLYLHLFMSLWSSSSIKEFNDNLPLTLKYLSNYNLLENITWPVTAVVCWIKAWIAVVEPTKQFPWAVVVDVTISPSFLARVSRRTTRIVSFAGGAKALICASKWIVDWISMETRIGSKLVRQKIVPMPQELTGRVICDGTYLVFSGDAGHSKANISILRYHFVGWHVSICYVDIPFLKMTVKINIVQRPPIKTYQVLAKGVTIVVSVSYSYSCPHVWWNFTCSSQT